jgi:hypothetical protein
MVGGGFPGGRRGPNRQKRRRLFFQIAAFFFFVLSILGLGFFSWWSGRELARLEIIHLEESNWDITEKFQDEHAKVERLLMDVRSIQKSRDDIVRKYEQDVPAGQTADLFNLMTQRLRNGVSPARLAQALTETSNLQRCTGTPQRRRVASQLSSTQEPDRAVFLGGLIDVLVSIPAVDANMKYANVIVRTGWHDQSLRFAGLPLRHDIIVNNMILSLEVKPATIPGYAMIDLASCPLPR